MTKPTAEKIQAALRWNRRTPYHEHVDNIVQSYLEAIQTQRELMQAIIAPMGPNHLAEAISKAEEVLAKAPKEAQDER